MAVGLRFAAAFASMVLAAGIEGPVVEVVDYTVVVQREGLVEEDCTVVARREERFVEVEEHTAGVVVAVSQLAVEIRVVAGQCCGIVVVTDVREDTVVGSALRLVVSEVPVQGCHSRRRHFGLLMV